MGSMRLGISERLALALRDACCLTDFVETGTYKGGTTAWALQHFERVTTIEWHEKYYMRALAMFLNCSPDQLKIIYGDSRVELAPALAAFDAPALIWLDAHWCGNYELSAGTPGECPLREELAAVNASVHSAEHCLLIDDARLFTAPPPRPHDPAQWPTWDEVKALLGNRFTTVYGDVIIAVPEMRRSIIEQFIGGRNG